MTILWDESVARSRWAVRLHQRARLLPPYEAYLRHRHETARCRFRPQIHDLDDSLAALDADLRRVGVTQTSLDALGVPDTAAAVAAADELCASLRAQTPAAGVHYLDVGDDELIARPQPYLWGLAPRLLDFVEQYLGLPANYLGVSVKREIANGVSVGTRNFHRDPEDDRVLKIIVYLNDVDRDTGPFECLTAADTSAIMRSLRNRLRFLSVDDIAGLVERDRWVAPVGPRGTAVVADTARCLHRASPPVARDRYSLTFSYLSRSSFLAFADGLALQAMFRERWGSLLDARQLEALQPPRAWCRRPRRRR
jgi:hypothetical protein